MATAVMAQIAGFNAFRKNPNAFPALVGGEYLQNFPTEATKDSACFCNLKKQLIEEMPNKVYTISKIGENDRAAMEGLVGGFAASYVTTFGYYVGEIKLPDGIVLATISPFPNQEEKRLVCAGFFPEDGKKPQSISLAAGKFHGAAILLAMYGYLKDIQEKEDESVELTAAIEALMNCPTKKSIQIFPYIISGITYYSFQYTRSEELDFGENISAGFVRGLTKKSLQNMGACEKYLFGTYRTNLLGEEQLSEQKDKTPEILYDFCQKYCSGKRTLEEIKEKYGWFSLDDEDVLGQFEKIVKTFTFSKRFPNIKNAPLSLMLTGAAGTGKSTMTEVAAWLAGLTYRPVVASGEKFSEQDICATLVPKVSISNAEMIESFSGKNQKMYFPEEASLEKEYGIGYSDVFAAPAIAYETLYGKEYDGEGFPDPEKMCMEITRREVSKRLESSNKKDDGEGFMMVLSEIGRTLLFGGVAEAQEFNMISNLNDASYFYKILQERIFTLPDGSVHPVHPDAHLVFTMNESEDFTRQLPPAFQTRHYKNIAFAPAGSSVMAKQALHSFEAQGVRLDTATVSNMANFMVNLRSLADNPEQISLRALNNWILASLDGEDMFSSCIDAVINIATSDKMTRAEMIGQLEVSPFYSKTLSATNIDDEEL